MKTITKIACRTAGTIGVGLSLYNACKISGHHAKVESEKREGEFLEKAYFNSRSITEENYVSNGIRKKTFDLMTKDPLPSFFGSIHGAIKGFLSSLGNDIILVTSSAFALLSKGFMAKVGALGICGTLIFKVLHDGLGVGKNNPMH